MVEELPPLGPEWSIERDRADDTPERLTLRRDGRVICVATLRRDGGLGYQMPYACAWVTRVRYRVRGTAARADAYDALLRALRDLHMRAVVHRFADDAESTPFDGTFPPRCFV